jgi:glyoxylase-like metal-dependent hydrolase (beta-lactamase superfamily II)
MLPCGWSVYTPAPEGLNSHDGQLDDTHAGGNPLTASRTIANGQLETPLTVEGAIVSSPESSIRYLGSTTPSAGDTLEIVPGIRWLRMPLPIDLNHINLWLIEDGDGCTLIDTGYPAESCTAVWNAIAHTLLRDRPLRRILLTHFHPDHMGCAAWLQNRFDVPVRIAARAIASAQLMVDGPSAGQRESMALYFTAHGMAGARAYLDSLAGMRRQSPVRLMPEFSQPLEHGEIVTVSDWHFEVIETDGHAVAHQSFFSAEPAVLISGDQILPTISPNIGLSDADWGLDPLGAYLASLDLLERLPAHTIVLPSHGRPFRGLRQRIGDLRAHHVRDLAVLREQIAAPRTAFELMPALYGRELKGFNIYLGLHECVAHLEHLVQRGEARRETTSAGSHHYRAL